MPLLTESVKICLVDRTEVIGQSFHTFVQSHPDMSKLSKPLRDKIQLVGTLLYQVAEELHSLPTHKATTVPANEGSMEDLPDEPFV